jgi:Kef-type K+ transport system membrane component KefB
MEPLLLFLIWIAAALFFPMLLKRFHVPWVTAVIFAGIILGPFGLGWVHPGETTNLLATLGLVLLMFSSGLDTSFKVFKEAKKDVFYFTLFNLCIPLVIGFSLGFLSGMNVPGSLLMGIVFSSSSVAVITPTLRELKVESKIRQIMTSTVFIEDVVSLIMFTILLNTIAPTHQIPTVIFPVALFLFLAAVFFLIPILQSWLFYWEAGEDEFAGPMRAVLVTLGLVALMAELIGLHAMVGGFLAGLTLSDMLSKQTKIKDRIFAVSYGFLIPIFLLNLGMTTNIATLFAPEDALFTLLIIASLMLSKSFSGYLAARLIVFKGKVSLGMGVLTSAQMSTTLATASIGLQYGIFRPGVLTSLVVLSIVSIVIAPFLAELAFGVKVEKPSKFELFWRGKTVGETM